MHCVKTEKEMIAFNVKLFFHFGEEEPKKMSFLTASSEANAVLEVY